MTKDSKKEKITINRGDLADPNAEFNVTEAELNLTNAKVMIDGELAEVVEAGEQSIVVKVPPGLGDGPLIMVVTTEGGKIVDVLTYEKGGIQKPTDEMPKDEAPDEWVTELAQAVAQAVATAVANAIGVTKGRSQRIKPATE
jgi:L-aminopeptidase/D-esterase-like protein